MKQESKEVRKNGWMWAFILFVPVALISVFSGPSYDEMTCGELTTEVLKMTGDSASEPYDLDKVRAINKARTDNGCWERMR